MPLCSNRAFRYRGAIAATGKRYTPLPQTFGPQRFRAILPFAGGRDSGSVRRARSPRTVQENHHPCMTLSLLPSFSLCCSYPASSHPSPAPAKPRFSSQERSTQQKGMASRYPPLQNTTHSRAALGGLLQHREDGRGLLAHHLRSGLRLKTNLERANRLLLQCG